jgi:hypothetical protein
MRALDIIRETEKAIYVKGLAVCHHTDQTRGWKFWVPKSLIDDDGDIVGWKVKQIEEDINDYFNYGAWLSLEY